MAADMDPLYARNPGTVAAEKAPGAVAENATVTKAAPEAATARDATAQTAGSTGYTANTGMLSQGALADTQLNRITAQDSPLMQQARQQGILAAAKRGLQNSSIAAGASEAEAVKAATPLALQNSAQLASKELADQAAVNRASEFGAGAQNTASLTNAQLGTNTALSNATEANKLSGENAALATQTSQANAAEANRVAAQNAALTTQNNQFNTGTAQNVNNLNAAAENETRANVLNANVKLNQQYLVGTQSLNLAKVQQQYGQLIEANKSASTLYDAYFNSISQAMASGIAPDRLAVMIDTQQSLLQHGLDLIDAMNKIDFNSETSAPAKP